MFIMTKGNPPDETPRAYRVEDIDHIKLIHTEQGAGISFVEKIAVALILKHGIEVIYDCAESSLDSEAAITKMTDSMTELVGIINQGEPNA